MNLKSMWEVFLLFLVPIGGGIPGGVVLAQSRGIAWPVMMLLYLASDIVLACLFEPILWLVILASTRSPLLARWIALIRQSMNQTIAKYGTKPGLFTLVMISFGIDPMTGRTAARAAGHRFISGWAVAIAGDMVFFMIIMASSLWLNNMLGDGTKTAVIIMIAMIVIPILLRRLRKLWKRPASK